MNARPLCAMRFAAILILATGFSGCIANTAGQMTLPAEVSAHGSYFVERSAEDTRDLAKTIAAHMQARGLNATAGAPGESRPGFDYVVTYTDRWFWDMRMYLADLRIEVRDAKDHSVVGFGQSSQSSLKAMGQSHEDVVDTALNQLFGAH
jgi:hypothetical protein